MDDVAAILDAVRTAVAEYRAQFPGRDIFHYASDAAAKRCPQHRATVALDQALAALERLDAETWYALASPKGIALFCKDPINLCDSGEGTARDGPDEFTVQPVLVLRIKATGQGGETAR